MHFRGENVRRDSRLQALVYDILSPATAVTGYTLGLDKLSPNSFSFLLKWQSIVQELCESRGGLPELSVLTNLLVSVDVKNY